MEAETNAHGVEGGGLEEEGREGDRGGERGTNDVEGDLGAARGFVRARDGLGGDRFCGVPPADEKVSPCRAGVRAGGCGNTTKRSPPGMPSLNTACTARARKGKSLTRVRRRRRKQCRRERRSFITEKKKW